MNIPQTDFSTPYLIGYNIESCNYLYPLILRTEFIFTSSSLENHKVDFAMTLGSSNQAQQQQQPPPSYTSSSNSTSSSAPPPPGYQTSGGQQPPPPPYPGM